MQEAQKRIAKIIRDQQNQANVPGEGQGQDYEYYG